MLRGGDTEKAPGQTGSWLFRDGEGGPHHLSDTSWAFHVSHPTPCRENPLGGNTEEVGWRAWKEHSSAARRHGFSYRSKLGGPLALHTTSKGGCRPCQDPTRGTWKAAQAASTHVANCWTSRKLGAARPCLALALSVAGGRGRPRQWQDEPTPRPAPCRQLGETKAGSGGSRQGRLKWGPRKERLRWLSMQHTREAGELWPRPHSEPALSR